MYAYGSPSSAPSDAGDWEQQITQLLSRTKQNLNLSRQASLIPPPPPPPHQPPGPSAAFYYATPSRPTVYSNAQQPAYALKSAREGVTPSTANNAAGVVQTGSLHTPAVGVNQARGPDGGEDSMYASYRGSQSRELDMMLKAVTDLKLHVDSVSAEVSRVSNDVAKALRRLDERQEALEKDLERRGKKDGRGEAWLNQITEWKERMGEELSGLQGDIRGAERRLAATHEALHQRVTTVELRQAIDTVKMGFASAVDVAVGPVQQQVKKDVDGIRRQMTDVVNDAEDRAKSCASRAAAEVERRMQSRLEDALTDMKEDLIRRQDWAIKALEGRLQDAEKRAQEAVKRAEDAERKANNVHGNLFAVISGVSNDFREQLSQVQAVVERLDVDAQHEEDGGVDDHRHRPLRAGGRLKAGAVKKSLATAELDRRRSLREEGVEISSDEEEEQNRVWGGKEMGGPGAGEGENVCARTPPCPRTARPGTAASVAHPTHPPPPPPHSSLHTHTHGGVAAMTDEALTEAFLRLSPSNIASKLLQADDAQLAGIVNRGGGARIAAVESAVRELNAKHGELSTNVDHVDTVVGSLRGKCEDLEKEVADARLVAEQALGRVDAVVEGVDRQCEDLCRQVQEQGDVHRQGLEGVQRTCDGLREEMEDREKQLDARQQQHEERVHRLVEHHRQRPQQHPHEDVVLERLQQHLEELQRQQEEKLRRLLDDRDQLTQQPQQSPMDDPAVNAQLQQHQQQLSTLQHQQNHHSHLHTQHAMTLTDLDRRIAVLHDHTTANTSAITTTQTTAGVAHSAVDALTTRVSRIDEDVQKLSAHASEREYAADAVSLAPSRLDSLESTVQRHTGDIEGMNTAVARCKEDMDDVRVTASTLASRVDDVVRVVRGHESRIDVLETSADAVDSEVTSWATRIDQMCRQQQQQEENMAAAVDEAVERRVGDVRSSVGALDVRVGEIVETVDAHATRLDVVKEGVRANTQALEEQEGHVEHVKGSTAALEARANTMQVSLHDHDRRIGAVESGVEDARSRVTQMAAMVTHVKEDDMRGSVTSPSRHAALPMIAVEEDGDGDEHAFTPAQHQHPQPDSLLQSPSARGHGPLLASTTAHERSAAVARPTASASPPPQLPTHSLAHVRAESVGASSEHVGYTGVSPQGLDTSFDGTTSPRDEDTDHRTATRSRSPLDMEDDLVVAGSVEGGTESIARTKLPPLGEEPLMGPRRGGGGFDEELRPSLYDDGQPRSMLPVYERDIEHQEGEGLEADDHTEHKAVQSQRTTPPFADSSRRLLGDDLLDPDPEATQGSVRDGSPSSFDQASPRDKDRHTPFGESEDESGSDGEAVGQRSVHRSEESVVLHAASPKGTVERVHGQPRRAADLSDREEGHEEEEDDGFMEIEELPDVTLEDDEPELQGAHGHDNSMVHKPPRGFHMETEVEKRDGDDRGGLKPEKDSNLQPRITSADSILKAQTPAAPQVALLDYDDISLPPESDEEEQTSEDNARQEPFTAAGSVGDEGAVGAGSGDGDETASDGGSIRSDESSAGDISLPLPSDDEGDDVIRAPIRGNRSPLPEHVTRPKSPTRSYAEEEAEDVMQLRDVDADVAVDQHLRPDTHAPASPSSSHASPTEHCSPRGTLAATAGGVKEGESVSVRGVEAERAAQEFDDPPRGHTSDADDSVRVKSPLSEVDDEEEYNSWDDQSGDDAEAEDQGAAVEGDGAQAMGGVERSVGEREHAMGLPSIQSSLSLGDGDALHPVVRTQHRSQSPHPATPHRHSPLDTSHTQSDDGGLKSPLQQRQTGRNDEVVRKGSLPPLALGRSHDFTQSWSEHVDTEGVHVPRSSRSERAEHAHGHTTGGQTHRSSLSGPFEPGVLVHDVDDLSHSSRFSIHRHRRSTQGSRHEADFDTRGAGAAAEGGDTTHTRRPLPLQSPSPDEHDDGASCASSSVGRKRESSLHSLDPLPRGLHNQPSLRSCTPRADGPHPPSHTAPQQHHDDVLEEVYSGAFDDGDGDEEGEVEGAQAAHTSTDGATSSHRGHATTEVVSRARQDSAHTRDSNDSHDVVDMHTHTNIDERMAEEQQRAEMAFTGQDRSSRGVITVDGFVSALEVLGLEVVPELLEEVLETLAVGPDRLIERERFLAWYMDCMLRGDGGEEEENDIGEEMAAEHRRAEYAFDQIDEDDAGAVSVEDCKVALRALGCELSEREVEAKLRRYGSMVPREAFLDFWIGYVYQEDEEEDPEHEEDDGSGDEQRPPHPQQLLQQQALALSLPPPPSHKGLSQRGQPPVLHQYGVEESGSISESFDAEEDDAHDDDDYMMSVPVHDFRTRHQTGSAGLPQTLPPMMQPPQPPIHHTSNVGLHTDDDNRSHGSHARSHGELSSHRDGGGGDEEGEKAEQSLDSARVGDPRVLLRERRRQRGSR